ncbi:LysR family transcriptional regulator [Epibacterium sp. Ofav1-8]|uniref:LysR family transcriptional regulator n=1 Tax=Epibacterium sp. Ofav1-8 TaxID=2917735 RepID=UPI001EF59E7A|nr:LysR family transcriptional regulator [Epibacterium sp. Ofav1-8]MCG7623371.1 LysR family transcriptional regulator [Epibacterium sp. Ofav1-8]
MDRLSLLETLIVALDEGSLNRAAQRRDMTQSAVSQQIKQLEALVGHQLLHRTAQGVRATRSGALVYAHAQDLLGGFDRMAAELDQMHNSLSGDFRISVNSFLGRGVIGPMLLELDRRHDDLNIIMRIEDRLVDVVRENYDLAIRTGRLGDTDGVGRRIASLETVLFATPEYLDQKGRPSDPEDLKHLKFIQHHEDQTKGFFPLTRNGTEHLAPIRVGFTADDPDLIMRAVGSGSGYTRAPLFFVQDMLRDGTFEQVLPHWSAPEKDVFAVYPSRHGLDRRRDLVIDGVIERLQEIRHNRPPARLHAITA